MLSIISAKNRTFAHIQPITFPFLIPSSACFLYSVPLLSQNICDAAGGGRDRHPHHPEHHGAQEYYDHTAVYQGSGCQQTGSQQKNHPDAEEMTGGFRPGLTDKVRFLFENRTKRVIVSVTAVTITLFFVTIRNYDYNFTSVTITNSCGYG